MKNDKTGLDFLNEVCGEGKDNAISLATIALSKDENGNSIPAVRDVSAFYEDGTFYVTTHALSNKVKESNINENVAFGVHFEGLSGKGKLRNLGWVLEESNSEIRTKLRETFEPWYDHANKEQDKNCCIIAIDVKYLRVFRNEGTIDLEFFI